VLATRERVARYKLINVTPKRWLPKGLCRDGDQSIVAAGDLTDAYIVPALLDGAMALVERTRPVNGKIRVTSRKMAPLRSELQVHRLAGHHRRR
jgi:hypothetical protein